MNNNFFSYSILLSLVLTVCNPIIAQQKQRSVLQNSFELFRNELSKYGKIAKEDAQILLRFVKKEPLTQRELNRKDLLIKRLGITIKRLVQIAMVAGVIYGIKNAKRYYLEWQEKVKKAKEKKQQKYKQEREEELVKLTPEQQIEKMHDDFRWGYRGDLRLWQSRKAFEPDAHADSYYSNSNYYSQDLFSNEEPSLFFTVASADNPDKFHLLRITIKSWDKDKPLFPRQSDRLKKEIIAKLTERAQPLVKLGYQISIDSRAQKIGKDYEGKDLWVPDMNFFKK